MAKENDYLGSFRLSQPEYEAAVALAKSREWSLSKLIRRSLQATIAAAKQGRPNVGRHEQIGRPR